MRSWTRIVRQPPPQGAILIDQLEGAILTEQVHGVYRGLTDEPTLRHVYVRMTWGSGQRKWFATLMTDVGKIMLAAVGVTPFIQTGPASPWRIAVGLAIAGICFGFAYMNLEE